MIQSFDSNAHRLYDSDLKSYWLFDSNPVTHYLYNSDWPYGTDPEALC